MNKFFLLILLLSLIPFNTVAQRAAVVKGFDGGMMLHTGFVKGEFPQLAHTYFNRQAFLAIDPFT